MSKADALLRQVFNAMQLADEIEGIEDPREYQDFMQKIEQTARERFCNSVDWERASKHQSKKPSRDEMVTRLVGEEYDFLNENREYLYDMIRDGFKGYENYTDEEIVKAYNDKFGED